MHPQRLRLPAATLLAALLTVPLAGQAAIEQRLADAFLAYETAMAELRTAADAKVRAGDDPDRVLEQLATLRGGAWPADVGKDLREAHARHLAALDQAFDAAKRACIDQHADELGRRIAAEHRQWARHWDLAPWQAVAADDLTAAKAKAADGRAPLPLRLPDAYRLEVEGNSLGDAQLLLPVQGKFVAVPLVVAIGHFHAVVTVGADGVVACDCGVPRTATPAPAAGSDGAPALLGERASILAVRWKALGDAPAPAAEAAAPAQPQPAADPRVALRQQLRQLDAAYAKDCKERDKLEARIQKLTELVAKLEARIARDRARGYDVSDMQTDCNTHRAELKSKRPKLEQVVARIDDALRQKAALERQLRELGG